VTGIYGKLHPSAGKPGAAPLFPGAELQASVEVMPIFIDFERRFRRRGKLIPPYPPPAAIVS
jgi:hypothetical protein